MKAENLPIFRYFRYDHLPAALQEISRPFGELAKSLVERYQDGDDIGELVVSLRKLLEAKDAAIRSVLR